jgi:hypothetical protein
MGDLQKPRKNFRAGIRNLEGSLISSMHAIILNEEDVRVAQIPYQIGLPAHQTKAAG